MTVFFSKYNKNDEINKDGVDMASRMNVGEEEYT
jgi:hypothetical protein